MTQQKIFVPGKCFAKRSSQNRRIAIRTAHIMANPPSSCHLTQGRQLIIADTGLPPKDPGSYTAPKDSLFHSKNKHASRMISSVPSEPEQSDCGARSLESEDESGKH